jgi:hypothetical protein
MHFQPQILDAQRRVRAPGKGIKMGFNVESPTKGFDSTCPSNPQNSAEQSISTGDEKADLRMSRSMASGILTNRLIPFFVITVSAGYRD